MRRLLNIAFLLAVIPLLGYGQLSPEENSLVKARFLNSQGKFEEAMKIAGEREIQNSTTLIWKIVEAEAALGMGNPDQAAAILVPFARDNEPDLLYQVARYFALAGNAKESCHFLSQHLASPGHLPARSIKTDKAFEGLQDTREWIRLWQNEWYNDLENSLEEIKYLITEDQLEEAKTKLEQLSASNQGSSEISFLRGKILLLEGKTREAVDLLRNAIIGGRKDKHLLIQMSGFFREKDFPDLELQTLNQLVLIDPTNPDYLIQRALLRMNSAKGNTTIPDLTLLEGLGITNAELDYQAGIRLVDQSPDKADQLLSRAIDQGTLDSRYYLSRGLLRCEHSRTDEGLADLAMSLDINPKQPELYLKRGEIRRLEGDQEGACYDWRKALEMGSTKAADLMAKYCR
jgi:tetratricopeptide (TPR) repeat protein